MLKRSVTEPGKDASQEYLWHVFLTRVRYEKVFIVCQPKSQSQLCSQL